MPKNKSDLMLTDICKIRKQSIDLTPATWSGNRGSGPRFAFCVVMAGDVLYRHRSTSLTLDRIGSFRLRPAFVVPLSTLAHMQTMRASPATRSPILYQPGGWRAIPLGVAPTMTGPLYHVVVSAERNALQPIRCCEWFTGHLEQGKN